jgi:hypothetical protein
MKEIFDIIINNGTALGVLAYLLYRDNKFMNNMVVTLTKIQGEIEELHKALERRDKNEYDE